MPQIINEDLQVKGLLSIDGESTGVTVDAQGLKRVGLIKYADRETGVWRLNNQDFEIGRVDAKVTALPGKPTAFTTDLYVAGDGKVGIWTTTPGFALDVADRIRLRQGPAGTAGLWLFQTEPNNDRAFIGMADDEGVGFWGSGCGFGLRMNTTNGNVGIWTTTPGFALDVADRIRLRQGPAGTAGLWLFQTEPNNDRAFIGMADDEGVGFWGSGCGFGLRMNTTNGNVGIGIDDPQARLHVNGKIIATDDIELQNGDCAEEFTIANLETIEPGTVMVLGEEDSLSQSTKAYDKKVAGVVSGAGNFKPGLILDKQPDSTNRMPIALMGKVYCKVDAQYAPIEVGDLLTTSPTPGHAMKATDSTKAFGAIIGKALKPLGAGTGLIPILVALQ